MSGVRVIVPKKEFKFTEKGSRDDVIKLKAAIFLILWDIFQDKTFPDIQATYPKIKHQTCEKVKVHGQNSKNVEDICDQMFRSLFADKDKMHILKRMQRDDVSIMFVNESNFTSHFKEHLSNNGNISSEQYVNKLIKLSRQIFYDIGREHKWCDNVILTPYMSEMPLLNAGNPVTSECVKEVISHFKTMKQRHSKLTITKTQTGEKQSVKKHSFPVSIAIVYYVMMEHFCELLTNLTRISHTERMVNLANLILVYMFCIHEGARPGDTTNHTRFQNMFFSFGEEFNLICLVFLSPASLAFLMKNGHIKRFVCGFYKGKQVGNTRARYISWKPCAYNSIDLATMFVILFKIIFTLEPNYSLDRVFKQGLNVASLLKRKSKKVEISGLTMYSIRYGAAEDDVSYNIPENWTRYRMGHTKTSFMKDKYAKNLNQRVIIDGVMSLLGSDVVDTSFSEEIPLAFLPVRGSIVHTKLDGSIPTAIIEELREIKGHLKNVFENHASLGNNAYLASKLPRDIPMLKEHLSQIPLGSHFEFKEELMSDKMRDDLQACLATIHTYFETVEKPDKVPVLWSYPQIIYGEWNQEFKEETLNRWNVVNNHELLLEIKNMVSMVQSHDKTIQPNFDDEKKNEPKKKTCGKRKKQKTSWDFNTIYVGNVVAIVSSECDEWSMNIPGLNDVKAWLCVVTNKDSRKKSITGRFFKGELGDFHMTDTIDTIEILKNESIAIVIDDVPQDVSTFELGGDKIQEIVTHVRNKFDV